MKSSAIAAAVKAEFHAGFDQREPDPGRSNPAPSNAAEFCCTQVNSPKRFVEFKEERISQKES